MIRIKTQRPGGFWLDMILEDALNVLHSDTITPANNEKMTLEEVQREINTLNEQVSTLNSRLAKLKMKELCLQFEKLAPVVGMAFKTKMGDARIIGLPEVIPHKIGPDCNMHELPVLIIDRGHDEEVVPFYEGTLYTQAVDSDDPAACLRSEYEEMNAGDWFAELDDVIEKMKRRLVCGAGRPD